ncbi:MAG: crotonase [Bacillota bacterium]|jgi:enoyl-CoA hydratase/carnithine racemase|nr:crotonase [Bacillota bacterium]
MESLIFEKADRIGIVRINRPKALNALNRQVIDELESLLDVLEGDETLSVLIIGSDEHFAAGADIRSMVRMNPAEAKTFSFSSTLDRIANLDIPTIAAMEGFALGGGMELALACDFRIASKTAKMGLPEINLAIMPGAGGTVRTPRLVGAARAKELILLGETIDAVRAEQIGLINKVVEPNLLMEAAMEWAQKLCQKAPIALKTAKESIGGGLNCATISEAIKLESERWADLFHTADQKEGMMAFIEKRVPIYKGK